MSKNLTTEQRVEIAYIAGQLVSQLSSVMGSQAVKSIIDATLDVHRYALGKRDLKTVTSSIDIMLSAPLAEFGDHFALGHVICLIHQLETELDVEHHEKTEALTLNKYGITDLGSAFDVAKAMIAAEREARPAA